MKHRGNKTDSVVASVETSLGEVGIFLLRDKLHTKFRGHQLDKGRKQHPVTGNEQRVTWTSSMSC